MRKFDEVSIRKLKEEDALISVNWRNNSKIWEYTLNSPNRSISLEDEKEWIRKVINEKNSHRFAILYKSQYIGNIQLTEIQSDYSYYGIFIGNTEYWGRRIGEKATVLILSYAFRKLKLKKVKLRVRLNHDRAINLYKKIGFVEMSKDDDLIHMEIDSKNFNGKFSKKISEKGGY